MMLTNLGIKSTYESPDGVAALDAIRNVNPDIMIMDWDMPVLDGREVMRIVRSPGVFPKANLPIIMLTDLGLQSRVTAAIRLGVHEFLVKPISPKTLQQRLLAADGAGRPILHSDAAPQSRSERIHPRGVTFAGSLDSLHALPSPGGAWFEIRLWPSFEPRRLLPHFSSARCS
jgi:CheY-like chemotaxis protein